jgi:hypothetical protein
MLIQQQVSDLLHGSKPLNNGQLELCGMGMLDRDTDTAETLHVEILLTHGKN